MKQRKVIIIGEHSVANDLVKQYEGRGFVVMRQKIMTSDGIDINDCNELCLLAGKGEDDKAVAMLAELAAEYGVKTHDGKRLICHLLVQDNRNLRMLQTCDLNDAVRQKMDVYPFSMDEVWSRGIVLDLLVSDKTFLSKNKN